MDLLVLSPDLSGDTLLTSLLPHRFKYPAFHILKAMPLFVARLLGFKFSLNLSPAHKTGKHCEELRIMVWNSWAVNVIHRHSRHPRKIRIRPEVAEEYTCGMQALAGCCLGVSGRKSCAWRNGETSLWDYASVDHALPDFSSSGLFDRERSVSKVRDERSVAERRVQSA